VRSPRPIPDLRSLLAASPIDPGCEHGYGLLDQLVELELAGKDPGTAYPGTAVHLQSCPGCRADYEGLRASATVAPSRGPNPVRNREARTLGRD
jgi:hypothetical protein